MEPKKENTQKIPYFEERELLSKQLIILAEKSSNCSTDELIKYTEQMVKIFVVLNNPCY